MKVTGQTMDENVRNLIISNNEQEARINAISLKLQNSHVELLSKINNLEKEVKALRNSQF